MKTLIASIGILVLSVLSTTASAATLEYVCDVEERIRTHAETGMSTKHFPENEKRILSYNTDGTGEVVSIASDGEPIVDKDFSTIRQEGVIRWEQRWSNALAVYTMWTKTKRYVEMQQLSTGATNVDFSWTSTGTCELRL